MLVTGIVIEVVIAAVCINLFGLGEGATLCFVLAALCIAITFAASHDDKPTPEVNKSQEVQEYACYTPNCPYCFSTDTVMDENGIGYCYDCDSYWE